MEYANKTLGKHGSGKTEILAKSLIEEIMGPKDGHVIKVQEINHCELSNSMKEARELGVKEHVVDLDGLNYCELTNAARAKRSSGKQSDIGMVADYSV